MNEPDAPQQPPDSATIAPAVVHNGSDSPQAFISYASADSAIANAVCHAIERAGVKCWIAPRDVTPGELYAGNIVHAIDSTRVVVLVLSQHAAESAHVLREIERASSKRHPIVSFRIDLAPLPDDFAYFLNTSQWLDASATGVDRALPRLVDAVKSALGKTAVVARVTQDPAVKAKARWRPSHILLPLAVIVAGVLTYFVADRFWISKRDTQKALVEATPASLADSSGTITISAKSIAVLPFADMSAEKNQEYMSDGIAEEVLNLLVQVPDLKVIARTSSFAFKGQNMDIAEIAKKLNVAHVLEGSVRTSGDKLRITAQLVRAADSTRLWSQTYDRQITNVFEVQDEIAASVVTELKLRLIDATPKVQKTDPRTFGLFLQAREIGRQGTEVAYESSNKLYKEVLARDPKYVAAWEGLAFNYANQAFYSLEPVDESIRLSREATNRALALAPVRVPTLTVRGYISAYYDLDLSAAAQHLKDALALEPANPDVLQEASALKRRLLRLDEAIGVGEYQISLDPLNPVGYETLGSAYYYVGRFDDALAAWRTLLDLSPGYSGAHALIGEALLAKGDLQTALDEMHRETLPSNRLIGLAIAHHALGRKKESDAALTGAIEKYSKQVPFMIAYAYAYRGEADRAFEWLKTATEYHDLFLVAVAGHPMLRRIHSDPRWLPFLRSIDMGPEQLETIKFEVTLPKS